MNFKKILGSFLSAMTFFSTSPAMSYDIVDEASLDEYMTKTDYDKVDGVIKNDITTTADHTSTNETVRLQADGNRVLSGELLRFTGSNGKLTLSIINGNTFTINNELYLDGKTLTNDKAGTYNFGKISGSGTLNLTSEATFTANSVTANSLTLNSGTSFTFDNGEFTSVHIYGSNGKNTQLNAVSASAVSLTTNLLDIKNYGIANVADLYVSGSASITSYSNLNAQKLVDGKKTGTITLEGTLNVGERSSVTADKINAKNITMTGSGSTIDLVTDSTNGILTVDETLTIGGSSVVKANGIDATTIISDGKIIIGDIDSTTPAEITTDSIKISKGEYTNTKISGKSGTYTDLSFSSGAKDITFTGDQNSLLIKGGSASQDALVTISDDSKLEIVAGNDDSSTRGVKFTGTVFEVGSNSELNLNAKESNITIDSGKKKRNIELGDNAVVNVSSTGSNQVILDNINHGTDSNNGTLNIASGSNAQVSAGTKDSSSEWVTGQIYVDKFVQNERSTFSMAEKSTLSADTVELNRANLNVTNISNGYNSSGAEKDGIHTKTSFVANDSSVTSSGQSKIYSDGTVDFNSSTLTVKDGTMTIGATGVDDGSGNKLGVTFDEGSRIVLDGELKIYDDENADVIHSIYGSVDNGTNETGVIRKVGKSTLNLGKESSGSGSINIDTIKLGIEKNTTSSTSSEKVVAGGTVNVNNNINSKSFLVAGDTTVNIASGITVGNEKEGSEIRFQSSKVYDKATDDVSSVLNMQKGAYLAADKIELSVKKADLYGGQIGIKYNTDSYGTSEIIFGEGSEINLYGNDVLVYVSKPASGGLTTQGATINLTGKGSLKFDQAIGSQAHWEIKNRDNVQTFMEGSWFGGVRDEDGITIGGVFNNRGTIIIGDNTIFGYTTANPATIKINSVLNKGGAIYNLNYVGMYPGKTSTGVSFVQNKASSEDVQKIYYFGFGGALYNAAEGSYNGIVALGDQALFDANGAGEAGGAIYNEAANGTGSYAGYSAIKLGDLAWFKTNHAGKYGGAIYTTSLSGNDSLIVMGKKSAFDNNVVGLDLEKNYSSQNKNYFYNAEGGAIYTDDDASVEIGAHSGFFNNFASYSGSAISNHGEIIFHDDGKEADGPLKNGEIVNSAVKFFGGGKRDHESKDATGKITKTGNVFYTHQGGAIYNNGGTFKTKIEKTDGTVTEQNGIYNGQFVNNAALFGGAIYNFSDGITTSLDIENSEFTGNSANKGVEIFYDFSSTLNNKEEWNSSGGAIYNAGHNTSYDVVYDPAKSWYPKDTLIKYLTGDQRSKMKIISSTFDGNTASNKAGAIYNDIMSEIEMSNSKFISNSASLGGAIYNAGSETIDGKTYVGAKIYTKLGEKGEKIIFSGNSATRQTDSNGNQTSLTDEFLGGALYNAGTIKQKDSTSTYDNEIIGFEFTGNYAGAGKNKNDEKKDVIGRGGALYNAADGTTYVGNSKFDSNYTYGYTFNGPNDDAYKAEGGAIYNEKGTLIIGDGAEFTNNGLNKTSADDSTGRGGAIYNANGATTIVESTKAKFSGNYANIEGGAIYNANGANLTIKNGVSIGDASGSANEAKLGGGVFNDGKLTLEDNVSFINNKAYKGGGLFVKEGSSVNADAAGVNHLSNVTFDGNTAKYGAGLYVDKNVDIYLDNVMFKGNSTNGIGSAFYNEGKLTLGDNNTFFNNTGSLIGNSGELIFSKGFEFDGIKQGNEGNTSFITNEENGVVKITTENGKSLVINGVGYGVADADTANGAAISLLDKSTIKTDSDTENTLKNAVFTKNKGRNGGAIYKESTESLKIDKTTFDGNIAVESGGAIYNTKGEIQIGADTVFANNSAQNDGGAIYNATDGTITFDKGFKGFSVAGSKNYSEGKGGAVSNDGTMNISYDEANNTDSIIFSNQGKDINTGNGGALHLGVNANVITNGIQKYDTKKHKVGYIKNGVFSNNVAQNGGALYNESNLIIEDTTITGNKSGIAGGAIYNKGSVVIGREYGILDIIVSNDKTITDNKSDSLGGAIYNEGGTVNISAKTGETATISGNTAIVKGGVIASDGGIINVGGNIKFCNNGTIGSNSTGGVFNISNGILNLDTTDGNIVFENNAASKGSAIYLENGGTLNFKGNDSYGITFSKDQTIASDTSTSNRMNVLGGNINFESSLSDFTGQYKQTAGTVTVANDFMNLKGTDNTVTGGKLILADGAKLMPTSETGEEKLNINGATIRFENNDSSTLTDLSVLFRDKTNPEFSNAGSSLTYTSDKGDAKIGLSDAKLELGLTQKFVDVIDEQTGEKFRKNSGEYSLILDGGSSKNLDIAKDERHAVSDLTVGDAVQIASDIKISKGGRISMEGAGLAKDATNYVKKIELATGAQLNIFNDTYETTVDGVKTKYNTDLVFYGDLIGDASSTIYKGYKNSATEDGLAGRASLVFGVLKDEDGNIISAASAAGYLGKYIQNAGTLEFESGSTYFDHTNTQVSFIEDARLILNDGVLYTDNTTIDFDAKGGKFVLGSATNIDMTNPNEKIEFEAKDKNGNTVHNTVNLGEDTTIQVTHGETGVDASQDTISIGKNNAFSGLIVGGEEDKNDQISVKVNTVAKDGADTTFNVEENGKLGFGDVKFVDKDGADVTGTYSPTVILDKNSEFYLVSGRNNDFKNLNLSTIATSWSETSGSLIKENASITKLTGDKTDLSDFHGTIVIKNGQIALGDDITEDKKFAADTRFDLSKLANGATVILDNITQDKDIRLINGIGNEIIGTPTGDENYALDIKNDKGSIIFTKDGTTEYIPDIDIKNGSYLSMTAKDDIVVGDVNVTSKFSTITGEKQESVGGLKSEGKITTGEIKVIGTADSGNIANSTFVLNAGKDITTGNNNVTVKYSDFVATSKDGSITFGDTADTTNPALSVVNGSASITAGKELVINGNVDLDSLTNNSLINGSSVSMGGLNVKNNADKMIGIGALSDKLSIAGDVTVDDTKLLQLTGATGIDIKVAGTEKGNVTVTDSKLEAITDTGNINIDGNLSADKSTVNIVVRDSGTGNVTIGNNSTTTPALSVTDSTVYISSEGATTIKGDLTMDNLSELSYVSGNSLDIQGDLSVTDTKYSTSFKAKNGGMTVGKIDLVDNVDPDGKNAKSIFLSENGDINAKEAVNASKADIIMSATNGSIKLASGTDGTGTALKVSQGMAQILADNALDINGDVEITEITEETILQGGSVSTGNINIHDNAQDTTIMSTVGDISTKGISVKDNNHKLTNIQSAGGITTNNGNVDVIDSKLQLIAQNGGVSTGDITLKDTVGGEVRTELGMAATDGSIKSGNIDLSSNVVLMQITSKTTGSTAATDITNGNIKISDNAKYQVKSAGKYTAGDIIANVAEGSESFAQILADGNITADDITASNLSDMYIRSTEGSVGLGDLTLTNVAVKTLDSTTEQHASVILADKGSITVKDITLSDMKTNPTYIQAKNALSAGEISLTKSDANIISTDGKVTATGNIKVDNSKIVMSAGDALTFGNAADLTNPSLKVNDGSATILAGGDITANGNIDISKSDLIMQSEEGGITLGEAVDLINPALKVVNGSANVSAGGGALNINGDVDMTAITLIPNTTPENPQYGAVLQGKSVAMENLKLYENTKDSVINATDGDISIKSITLTNNQITSAAGAVENRWTQIVAEDGNVNVTKDINVLSSNLSINAENGGISANDFIIKDSKIDGTTANSKYDAGTILASGVGNIGLKSVSVADSVVGIGSVSGNIDIDKSITVSDTKSTTPSLDYADYLQTVISSEEGDVSVGRGVVASEAGTPVDIITANTNTYVTVQGYDINLGNSTTDTAIKAKESLLIMAAGNDLNAENTALVVNDAGVSLEAEGALKIGSITSSTSAAGLESGNVAGIYAISNSGNVEVNGNISASYSTIGLESETGIAIKGKVDLQNSNAAIVSVGDVAIDGTVTLKNTVASTGTTSTTGVSRFLSNNSSSSTLRTNNDTPDAEVNEYIAQIQEAVSDIDPHYTIDGNKVNIKGNLDVDLSVVKIGDNDNLSKLEVKGNTTIDDSVVMINASGDVVTNGFTSKDSIIGVNAKNLKASNMSISSSSKDSPAYFEMANGNVDVKNNMVLSNTILNAKNTTNVAVGGTGSFNYAYLNIPNASAQFGALKTKDTVVNLRNNDAHNTINVTGNYEVSGDNLYYMDFDPATGAYDRVHVGGAISGEDGATITVNSKLISQGDIANGFQVYDVFSGDKGVSGVNFGLQGDTQYTTALANYQMQSIGNGKYAFKRTGYTPTALVNPVAAQVGGFLTQVQTYDTAFDNLDMVMMLPMTAYAPNRYAVEEEDAMVYSPLFIPELEKGVWFRPFANFENVDMHNVGDRISAQTYGALAGGDTALKDLGNGYQGMMSAYVGYTGSHQDLDGVSNYQNGGVVGVTGAIYKNGFFSGLTVSANASGNTASTPYGNNDFFMLTAGAASKTGYNWELANGRFIIQPSWLMSYTFANAFNPNDIAGMKVDSSALHAVQLAPGLKFIGNFPNGWQPYLTVDYRFNICDKADYKVGVVDLPDAQVKSYIEYGLGMQKRWGDRFTGYGQFLGRGIGRNGVGLNLGMRWMVGDGRNPR